ncbi:MAG: phytanoyl-CoA dioxygenase family protein [bacterium]
MTETVLTQDQQQQFIQQGYVVLENFKTPEEIERLREAALQVVDTFDFATHQHVFSTAAQAAALGEYFLTSGDQVRCFLEPGAADENGHLQVDKRLSVNKLGHAMHDRIPAFRTFSADPRLQMLMHETGVREPHVWQSMYIFKQPRIGGEVGWHQDATYFFTEPLSVKTLWFAIDDATLENGCLWVADTGPQTPLREVFEVIDGRPRTRRLDATPWPDLQQAQPLEVKAGSLVCFSGTLPHYSAPNRSDKARHAYTLHVVDAQAIYPQTNWIQRGHDLPVRGFL